MCDTRFTRKVTVLPSQASSNSQLKLRSLLDLFQDTAAIAVADLEGTSTELMARGYAWVLRCYEIEFLDPFALPMLDESFEIKTWHDPSHGYNMLREFQVTGANGKVIIWAKTAWLLLDLAAGRPVRPSEHIPRLSERYTDNISPDFRDVPREKTEKIEKITASAVSGTSVIPWTVRFHDLDANGHVNNAAYFEWIFEATLMVAEGLGLGATSRDGSSNGEADGRNSSFGTFGALGWKLKSVAATFRSSVRWGDKVSIAIEPIEPASSEKSKVEETGDNRTFVYRIVNESNPGKSGPVFVCTWQKTGLAEAR